jgi:hypothetical protein
VNDACTEDTGPGMPPMVDMGAYEFQPPCPSDVDCNGVVNVLNLLAVIAAWGGVGDADVNSDGMVDVLDLLEVIAAWGPCPWRARREADRAL